MQKLLEPFILYLITQRCVAQNTSLAYRRDVQQFLEFWAKNKKKNKKNKTKISEALGEDTTKPMKEDLRVVLIDFRDLLRKQGIGSRSISRKLSALRAFFHYVSEYHPTGIAGHEVSLMVGAPPRLERRLPRVCSLRDINLILQAARGEKDIALAELICYLLYTAGLRVSELVGLKHHDVQLAAGHITIRGKGGKMRTIPLVSAAKEALVRYHESRTTQQKPLSKSTGTASELKPNKNTSPRATSSSKHNQSIITLSRQTVWRLIKRLARRAGIANPVSPHVLRHSLATHSLEEGWDLRSLQLMLGHERIATTEMYIHLDTRFVRSEYKKRHPRG